MTNANQPTPTWAEQCAELRRWERAMKAAVGRVAKDIKRESALSVESQDFGAVALKEAPVQCHAIPLIWQGGSTGQALLRRRDGHRVRGGVQDDLGPAAGADDPNAVEFFQGKHLGDFTHLTWSIADLGPSRSK